MSYLAKKLNDEDIKLTKPLGYLDFLNLVKDATLVLADSG